MLTSADEFHILVLPDTIPLVESRCRIGTDREALLMSRGQTLGGNEPLFLNRSRLICCQLTKQVLCQFSPILISVLIAMILLWEDLLTTCIHQFSPPFRLQIKQIRDP